MPRSAVEDQCNRCHDKEEDEQHKKPSERAVDEVAEEYCWGRGGRRAIVYPSTLHAMRRDRSCLKTFCPKSEKLWGCREKVFSLL